MHHFLWLLNINLLRITKFTKRFQKIKELSTNTEIYSVAINAHI